VVFVRCEVVLGTMIFGGRCSSCSSLVDIRVMKRAVVLDRHFIRESIIDRRCIVSHRRVIRSCLRLFHRHTCVQRTYLEDSVSDGHQRARTFDGNPSRGAAVESSNASQSLYFRVMQHRIPSLSYLERVPALVKTSRRPDAHKFRPYGNVRVHLEAVLLRLSNINAVHCEDLPKFMI